eukprot:383234-Prorocentrum_minimum.AAC.2
MHPLINLVKPKLKLQPALLTSADYVTAITHGRVTPFSKPERLARIATRNEPWWVGVVHGTGNGGRELWVFTSGRDNTHSP